MANYIDTYIVRALFNTRYRDVYNVLYTVYRIMYPEVVAGIESRICPFCHRSFRDRHRLYIHIIRSKTCRQPFMDTVKRATETYRRLPRKIHGKYYYNGRKYREIHTLLEKLTGLHGGSREDPCKEGRLQDNC